MVIEEKNSAVSAPSAAKAFVVGERRVLRVANGESRIADCEVEHVRREKEDRCRFYESTIDNRKLEIQLNHGSPADDEARLEEILTELANPDPSLEAEEIRDSRSAIRDSGGEG